MSIGFSCLACGKYNNEVECYYCRRRQDKINKGELFNDETPKNTYNRVPEKDPYKFKGALLVGDKLRGMVYGVTEGYVRSVCDATVTERICGDRYRLKCTGKAKENEKIYFDELSNNYGKIIKSKDTRKYNSWNECNVHIGDLFMNEFFIAGRWLEVISITSEFINCIEWKTFTIEMDEDKIKRTFERVN